MPCLPGGRSCKSRSSPTPAPCLPVPLSTIVTVPTLLPWASFISTTVLAALDSVQRTMADDTAAVKNRLCFMVTNYNQATVLRAISSSSSSGRDNAYSFNSASLPASKSSRFGMEFTCLVLGAPSSLWLQNFENNGLVSAIIYLTNQWANPRANAVPLF